MPFKDVKKDQKYKKSDLPLLLVLHNVYMDWLILLIDWLIPLLFIYYTIFICSKFKTSLIGKKINSK